MAFFGRYIEVTPHARLVWTNEEGDGGEAVTTVTFEEKGGKTLLVLHELHPSKEAVDDAIGFGEGLRETFEQLDELLVTLAASSGRNDEGLLLPRSASRPSSLRTCVPRASGCRFMCTSSAIPMRGCWSTPA